MLDRHFSDTDLRTMLDDATGFHKDHEPGRFAVETSHGGKPWLVIVEPQDDDEILVIVTAYNVE